VAARWKEELHNKKARRNGMVQFQRANYSLADRGCARFGCATWESSDRAVSFSDPYKNISVSHVFMGPKPPFIL
jgi:hypothetical protein